MFHSYAVTVSLSPLSEYKFAIIFVKLKIYMLLKQNIATILYVYNVILLQYPCKIYQINLRMIKQGNQN